MTDGTKTTAAKAKPQYRVITGSYVLADNLRPEIKRGFARMRWTPVGKVIVEIDACARRAAAQHKRKPGRQTEHLLAEAEAVATCLVQEYIDNTDPDFPMRDEETGELEYDDSMLSEALQWIDNFEAMGIHTDTTDPEVQDPYCFNEYRETMPEDQIFPLNNRTVNWKKLAPKLGMIEEEDAQFLIDQWKEAARNIGATGVNRKKAVVSIFDYTGNWSQPWDDAGYQVIRLDIKTGADLLFHDWPWNQLEELKDSGIEIHGLLSACPCTTFAGSGSQWWKTRHDVEDPEMLRAVFGEDAHLTGARSAVEYNIMLYQATRDMIRMLNPTGFHVLENPIGRIQAVTGLSDPVFRFDPNNYGSPYTKFTNIFGKCFSDLPVANVLPHQGSKMQNSMRGDDALGKEERSETPEGFAYAFFMANDPTARLVKDKLCMTQHPEMIERRLQRVVERALASSEPSPEALQLGFGF